MFQNSSLSKPKWGAQAAIRGGMAPLGPLLATALILVPKKFLVPVSVYSSTHTGIVFELITSVIGKQ